MKKKSTLIKNGTQFFDLLCDVINHGFEKGMSQSKICVEASLPIVTLSGWVNGRGAPGFHQMMKLAKATGYSLRPVLAAWGFDIVD